MAAALYDNASSAWDNFTTTPGPTRILPPINITTLVTVPIYGLICAVGLIGNGLVVFVIIKYTKMKTVTNMYILNLSSADFLFLLGMPLIMTTAVMRHWIFGAAMCKMYFVLTSINWFTGAFTLTVMSGDRFLAVVYPITSMKYRTPKYAIGVIVLVWMISFLVMLPVVLYAKYQERGSTEYYTCNVKWPSGDQDTGNKIFILYILLVGFVIPILMICLFYTLLLVRLKTSGPQVRSGERRRSHRKVTKLVTLIIAVYILCWLPFWIFQVKIAFGDNKEHQMWMVNMFTVFSLLSYANSMVNPVLYAFTNENFRESFISAFKCAKDPIMIGRRGSEYASGVMPSANNNSVRARHLDSSNSKTTKTTTEQTAEYEFTMLNSNSNGSSPGKLSGKTPSAANGEASPALSSSKDEEKTSFDV